jgi:GntR family transcriptional regulator
MPVLASGNPVPRYARLAQLLRQRIDKGVWKPGDHLPRLEDLMLEFDVARVTVRQAVALLARDGWVSVGRGRGTVVQARLAQDTTLVLETSLAGMADAYRTDKPTLTLIDERIAAPPARRLRPAGGGLSPPAACACA